MESAPVALNVSSVFRWLRSWNEAGPATLSSGQLPFRPTVTYDTGLPSLPDDVIHEIFSLLDMEGLKSCSLTGQVMSLSVKPFIHRTLHLTPRNRHGFLSEPNTPGNWNEFKGLPVLGQRGLLQHTRHLSIFLCRNPLFPHDLQPHVQHFRTLTNLRSLKTRWLDIPSFLPKMEEYFGPFFETLQSLELEHPRGDHKQILYFICQFKNLRDLRIKGTQDHVHSMRNGGPHFDIKTIPPLDGTLDLELYTGRDRGSQLVLAELAILPLKPRALKLLGCTGANCQLLIDACGPSLECMDFMWYWAGDPNFPRLDFKSQPALRKLEITLAEWANTELFAAWLSGTLPTITSNGFMELVIFVTRVKFSFNSARESQVREWNSVDNMLDRLSLCEDVTLVVRVQGWTVDEEFRQLIEKYFPLMWESGRVVLEAPSPNMKGGPMMRTRICPGQTL